MISKYTKFTWIVLLGILILPALATAQTLTNKERRNMNLKLLDAIEIYETASTLRGANASYDFIDLFESEDTRIYCDLLDYTSSDNKISVSEYVRLLSEKEFVETSIKEVMKSKPVYEEDGWHTNITFQKRLNYIDSNGVWFSSDEHYGAEYNIMVDFVYNPQEQTCYIADINGTMPSDRERLPNKFVVVQDSPERTKPIYYTQTDQIGKKSIDSLSFNSFHQAFINNLESLRASSDNIHINHTLLAQNNKYDLVNLSYKTTRWRAKAHAAWALGNFDKKDTYIEKKFHAWELGLDLGVTFGLGRNSQMGFFSGIGYQECDIDLSLSESLSYKIEHSYKPNPDFNSADKEDNSPPREYTIKEASQSLKLKHFVVPIYIEFEHHLGDVIYLNWSLGAKLYLSSNEKESKPYKIKYSNSEVSDTTDEKEFTSFLYPSNGISSDFLDDLRSNISAMFSVGADVNLYDKRIFFSIKAAYEYGLDSMLKATGQYYNADNDNKIYLYPIVYHHGEKRDIATRSLFGSVDLRRSILWIKGGLTFKF